MKNVLAVIIGLFASSLAMAVQASLWEQSTLNKIVQRGELVVCLEAGYMPFEMLTKKGDVIGFDVDVAKHMASAMNAKLRYEITPWQQIIPALIDKKCDIVISGMTITAQRNLEVNFSNPYFIVGQTVLISPKLKGKVKHYRDLNNEKYKVAFKRGSTSDEAAKKHFPKAKFMGYKSESDGASQIIKGTVDAFIYDLPFNTVYSAQNPGKVLHLDNTFTYEPLGWAIRKGDPDFMNFLNNFLVQMKGDGTYETLYRKWFVGSKWLQEIE